MAPPTASELNVTVVIPAYNRAALISRALDSVINQTRRPSQVIVVDDASSDDTVKVTREWSESNAFPITVELLSRNGGAAAARNRGIELATARYVSFLDSDDEHLPTTLERLVKPLESIPQSVLSFGDGTVVTLTDRCNNGLFRPHINLEAESERIESSTSHLYRLKDAKNTLLKASIIPTSATCFLREAAISVGGMPTNFRSGEDWLFWLRLAEKGWFIFQLEDLVLHHRHDANLTRASRAEFMAREKLKGFASLLDGSLNVSLSSAQRAEVECLVQVRIEDWRYHLSCLGLQAYMDGIKNAKAFTGKTSLTHLITDPRSIARATFASLSLDTAV